MKSGIFGEIFCYEGFVKQPMFHPGRNVETVNEETVIRRIYTILGRPSEQTWPEYQHLPAFQSIGANFRQFKPHSRDGEEVQKLRDYFTKGEGISEMFFKHQFSHTLAPIPSNSWHRCW